MSKNTASRRRPGLWMLCSIALLLSPAYSALSDPIVTFDVGENYAHPGEQNVPIEFLLSTTRDTIMGFVAWLQVDRPYAVFNLGIDTAGMACSGWDITVRSLTGLGFDIQVKAAAANINLAIAPDDGIVLPFALYMDALAIADSITDRRVNIIPNFKLDPEPDSPPDTICYICTQWVGEFCLEWTQIFNAPCDSMAIIPGDTILTTYGVTPGWIEILPDFECGDIDGSEIIDIADLVYFVQYLFTGGPPPQELSVADLNGDGTLDIADLTRFAGYFFGSGQFLECPESE